MAHFIVAKLWLFICWVTLEIVAFSGPASEVVQEVKATIVALLCWCRLMVSGRQVLIRMQLGAGQGDGTDVTINCMCSEPVTVVWHFFTACIIYGNGLKPTKEL